jgi:hypothetical protein
MFGRDESIRALIAEMQEEARCRDREFRRRDEESKGREKEFKRRERERKEEFERLVEASERRTEETREYGHEILLRNEKVYKWVIARLEELNEETRASVAQIKSNTEETRAQTQALLRLIDRMDETGGAAAA